MSLAWKKFCPLLCFTLLASACAFEPGDFAATVIPTLSASLDLDEMTSDQNGWIQLDEEKSLQLTGATLSLHEVRLMGASSSQVQASEVFDPAHPPEGYSLCHGGHCHSASGSLVDYATIQEELSGASGSSIEKLLTMTSSQPVDLLNPEGAVSLTCPMAPQGQCTLDSGKVLRVELSVAAVHFTGLFRSTANETPQPVDLTVELDPMTDGLFVHATEFTAQRRGEKHFHLDMKATVFGEALGEVDWSNPDADLSHFKHLFSESAFTLSDEPSNHDHEGHDHDHADHEGHADNHEGHDYDHEEDHHE